MAHRLLLSIALAACGGHIADVDASTPHCQIAAAEYGTSCSVAADCASVFLGNACTATCMCENGVISKSGLAQYQADLATVDSGGVACPCPPPLPPSCCQGQCVAGPCP